MYLGQPVFRVTSWCLVIVWADLAFAWTGFYGTYYRGEGAHDGTAAER